MREIMRPCRVCIDQLVKLSDTMLDASHRAPWAANDAAVCRAAAVAVNAPGALTPKDTALQTDASRVLGEIAHLFSLIPSHVVRVHLPAFLDSKTAVKRSSDDVWALMLRLAPNPVGQTWHFGLCTYWTQCYKLLRASCGPRSSYLLQAL